MFQDTAGTTPVTTPGQTVALLLDKSKGLVLGSEVLVNGTFDGDSTTGWTLPSGSGVSGGKLVLATPVSNVTTATTVVIGKAYQWEFTVSNYTSGTVNFGFGRSGVVFGATGNGTYRGIENSVGATTAPRFLSTGSPNASVDNISVKELAGSHATQATTASRPTYGIVPLGGRRNLLLATDTMATQSLTVAAVAHTLAFTGTGTVTLTGASIAGPLVGTGASNRVSLTFTPTAASLTLTVVGSVTLAQLELGSTATAYQRVTTQYDVTETGVQSLSYLSFDGVDDGMVTGTITPGTDKAQVFAGVRKLSDAATGMLAEFSASVNTNAGTLNFIAPESGGIEYGSLSKGNASVNENQRADFNSATAAAPVTSVLTATHDIPADLSTIRHNGVAGTNSTGDKGTGNFLVYPLYIGRRGGTSLPFNGQIYNLIVRFGANLDAGTITSTETFVNGKTGAY
jgi:hypothetical protein